MVRYIDNDDYVCRVLEEIVLYNRSDSKIMGYLAVVEKGEKDLK